MANCFAAVKGGLSPEHVALMQQGSGVSARDLGERTRCLLSQGVALHWAHRIVSALARPPAWVGQFGASSVEFGLYRNVPELGRHAGREYVKLHGPEGAMRYQTGIGEERG